MGFFTKLFSGSASNVESTPRPSNNDVETNKLLGQLFNQLAGNINSHQYQTQVSQVLLTKRQRAMNSEQYIDLLINNVTYFVEMEKEMLKILERVFSTKSIPGYNKVEEEIIRMQAKKKEQMSTLARQNKNVYENKYKTNNQKIESLQFDYAYHSLVHELIINIIDAVTNNSSFTNQLFRSSAKYNIDTINNYLSTYANMKTENISFKI